MEKLDFSTYLNGIRNDFKISVDDLFNAIEIISENTEKVRLEATKPDINTAKALIEYLNWEESKSKKNFEVICGEELEKWMDWLEKYSSAYKLSKEEILKQIIGEF